MRNSYEVRAQKFIREIFPFLTDCVDCWDYEDAVYNYMIEHPRRKVRFDHGMTRVAIITSDYVVKIDYSDDHIKDFGGGEQEILFYQMAEREGMAHLFAKISRYDFGGRRFYIMPRVKGIDEYRWEDAWFFMSDEEHEWCEDHHLYDLHSKNYGLVNGKVCIFDYGAYDQE